MFVDAVGANLLMFAVGQVFAWLYLRGGRFWLGAGATLLLWVAADWWILGRFLMGMTPREQVAPLLLLQATALWVTCAFLWAAVRRRRGRGGRAARHRDAVRKQLSGDYDAAVVVYRQLVWADGRDAAAWIGLGDALRRAGRDKPARRSYARARAVDVERRFQDLLGHRIQLLRAPVLEAKTSADDGLASSSAARGGRGGEAAGKARSAG